VCRDRITGDIMTRVTHALTSSIVFAATLAFAVTHSSAATIPADKSKFHIFICMGQSNMAGAGPAVQEDITADARVLKMGYDGAWYTGVEPTNVNPWGSISQTAALGAQCVGPSFSFAKALADSVPGITVGIVNIAMSGTNIEVWQKGSPCYLYGYCPTDSLKAIAGAISGDANYTLTGHIDQVARAARDGTIKGILWHQGEANSGDSHYRAQLAQLIADWRSSIGNPSLPVVVGHVGTSDNASIVNAADDSVARTVPYVGVASSNGLTVDGPHYNAASQHTFGKRYCAQYLAITRLATAAMDRPRTPAAAEASIRLAGRTFVLSRSSGRLRIVDASGAQVREWVLQPRQEGCRVTWDGRDDRGRLVPHGLYIASVGADRPASILFFR
jgi:hypothetical protein